MQPSARTAFVARVVSLVLAILLVGGCGAGAWPSLPAGPRSSGSMSPPRSPSSQVRGTLSLGAAVQVAAGASVPGKEVTIAGTSSEPGLAGFSIDIPAEAFAAARSFTVTASPINGSTFGPLIRPISELFAIDNGGVEAESPIAVRIPGQVPAGSVSGAFYYDQAASLLEGLPIVAADATGVTVLTRHFSSIFLSIAEAGLPATVDSGFLPSLDGWQIPNPGSYAAPDGYCSGDSLTMMWYFLTQHRAVGAAHLYGTYDNNGGSATPPLWQDDASAIRLASTVQVKTDWDSLASRFFWKQEWIAGSLAYDAFRYTMAVTGEPQLIFAGRGGGGWHAMVVYRVDPDRLWIADPNFHGQDDRTIAYDRSTGTLAPYAGTETYTTFLYAAKSAIAPWSDLATDWSQFEDGTIGDDVFPPVDFERHDGLGMAPAHEPLTPGYETDQATVYLSADSNPIPTKVTVYSGANLVAEGGGGWPMAVRLKVGDNDIGILIAGQRLQGEGFWIHFKRFTITRTGPSPSPSAGGGWDLVSGPDQIGETAPISGIGWTADGNPGSLLITASTTKEELSAQLNWTAPDALMPGDPLDIGATATAVKTPSDCDNAYDTACDFSAEIDAGLLVTAPPSSPQQGPVPMTSVTARGAHWQASSLPIVPDYDPAYGSTMVLQVGVSAADGQRWYQYVYKWGGSR
jgi:hypothetical protein